MKVKIKTEVVKTENATVQEKPKEENKNETDKDS